MKKINFIERWTSHSRLFAVQGFFNSYIKFRGKIIGCENKNLVCHGILGDLYVFYDKEELDKSGTIGCRFLKSRKNVLDYIADSTIAKDEYLKICRQIFNTDFNKLSNKEISKIFKDLFDCYSKLMAYYRMSNEEFYFLMEAEIKKELNAYAFDIDRAYQLLASCESNNKIDTFKERRDWLLLLIKSKIKSKNKSKELSAVAKHALKYGYLGAGGGNPFGWDYNFFIRKYRMEVKEKRLPLLKREYQKIVNQDKTIRKQKKKLIKEHNISANIVYLTHNISLMSCHRISMREDITKGAYLSRPIFTYIYNLIGRSLNRKVKFEVLRQLTFEEIYYYLLKFLIPHRLRWGNSLK